MERIGIYIKGPVFFSGWIWVDLGQKFNGGDGPNCSILRFLNTTI